MTLCAVDSQEQMDREEAAFTEEELNESMKELLRLSIPDFPLIFTAFTFVGLASVAAAYIPKLTGDVVNYCAINPNTAAMYDSIWKLLMAAGVSAVCTSIRGGLFIMANARLNIRIRRLLFGSLLQQEIGFFDRNNTGELTNRLSSDPSVLGDQINYNVQVFFRNNVQGLCTLGTPLKPKPFKAHV